VSMFMRRRAERFAELLDDHPAAGPHHHSRSGNHTPGSDDPLAHLVRVGHGVSERSGEFASAAAMDPGFRTALRDRLMADAMRNGIGTTRRDAGDVLVDDPQPRPTRERPVRPHRHAAATTARWPWRGRLVLIGGAAAAVVGIAGVAAASSSALPGDPLYDVKRSTERAQLALAGSDLNSGELYLQFARTRAGEAKAVRNDPAELASVLSEMDTQTRKGVALLDGTAVSRRDPASLTEVATFAAQQRPDLVGLLSGLNGSSRTEALKSLALVDEVSQRAGDLRRLLPCTAGQGVVSDQLGPVPRQCSAAPGSKASVSASQHGGGQSHSGGAPAPGVSHKPGPSQKPSPSPSTSGGLPGGLLPSIGGSPSPSPSGSGDNGGLLGTIGKILGGLL